MLTWLHSLLTTVRRACRPGRALQLISFALLALAWGVVIGGVASVGDLAQQKFGRCEEAYEALARDLFIAKYLRVSFFAALALDMLAFVPLYWMPARESKSARGVVAWFLVWLPSVAVHGLGLMMSFIPTIGF